MTDQELAAAFQTRVGGYPNGMPKIGDPYPYPPGTLRLDKVKARPRWGYNPIRWLLRRPKRWDAEFTFEVGGKR